MDNKKRTKIYSIVEQLEDIKSRLETINEDAQELSEQLHSIKENIEDMFDDEQQKYDNMYDRFPNSERTELLEASSSSLESANDCDFSMYVDLDDLIQSIDDAIGALTEAAE